MSESKMRFSLPDFADSFRLNLLFVRFAKENPVLLQDHVSIDSIYGCFPNCLLNGGRAFVRDAYSLEDMDAVFHAFSDFGVTLRLTFTNMLATEQDLRDPYVNEILSLAQRYGGQAIVYADFVGDYIRDNYGLSCVLSTTREINDVDEFNRMTKRYDHVVLNYNYNKDRAFIDRIEDKQKTEVMVNEYCSLGCPRRREHYVHNSTDQVNEVLTPYDCHADKLKVFMRHEPGDPVFFTCDEVKNLWRETGIQNFKIVGRGIPFDVVLESYVYYLVKQEYREDVRAVIREALKGY